jgi:hypothetical protein
VAGDVISRHLSLVTRHTSGVSLIRPAAIFSHPMGEGIFFAVFVPFAANSEILGHPRLKPPGVNFIRNLSALA